MQETEISEKLKNSTRGRELLQEVIYVFHPKELNWVTRIMRLEMGVLHFYKEENHQITLQSMIYLSGCEINFENQHKNKFIVRIKRTNRNPICSVYTPSGEELKEFFNDYFIDLQFSNKVIAKKSLEVIQKAIELNIVPLEDLVPLTNQQSQAIYECDYQFLSPSQEFVNQQQNANPSAPLSQENSILSTFNILLSRYFTDIQQSDVFLEEVYNFLKSKFSKLPRPDFLVRFPPFPPYLFLSILCFLAGRDSFSSFIISHSQLLFTTLSLPLYARTALFLQMKIVSSTEI